MCLSIGIRRTLRRLACCGDATRYPSYSMLGKRKRRRGASVKSVQRQAVGRFPKVRLFEEIMAFSSAEVKMSITVIIRRNTAQDVCFMSAFCLLLFLLLPIVGCYFQRGNKRLYGCSIKATDNIPLSLQHNCKRLNKYTRSAGGDTQYARYQ